MARRCPSWRVLALLAALAVLPYANVQVCGFVADDYARIVEDPNVRNIRSARRYFLPGFWRANAATSNVAYRPMRPLLAAIDYAAWGMNPAGFHWTNVGLHAAVVLLVFALLRQLGMGRGAAFLAAAVFGLHAANVEAVAWVKNRTILAAGACMLLAMVAGLRRGRWVLASVAFAVALLSHEQTAAGALWAAVAVAALRDGKGMGRTWPLWGVLVVYFGLRSVATSGEAATASFAAGQGWLPTLFRTLGTYGCLAALPVRLNLERALMAWGPAAAGLAVLALLPAVGARRGRVGATLAAGFLLLLAPVSNLVPVSPSFGRLVAEQRLYLPLAAGCALPLLLLRGRRRRAWLLVLLVVCAGRVAHRVFDWRSDETIYRNSVAHAPGDFKARYNLGDAFLRAGRYAQAERQYERSLALNPQHGGTRCRYAQALRRLGRIEEARAQLRRVLGQRPPSRAAPMARELLKEME